jgi:hypothetical protein
MTQEQIDELIIEICALPPKTHEELFTRMLGFVNKHVEDGKEVVNIQEFYKHLDKMYKKFGKG